MLVSTIFVSWRTHVRLSIFMICMRAALRSTVCMTANCFEDANGWSKGLSIVKGLVHLLVSLLYLRGLSCAALHHGKVTHVVES